MTRSFFLIEIKTNLHLIGKNYLIKKAHISPNPIMFETEAHDNV